MTALAPLDSSPATSCTFTYEVMPLGGALDAVLAHVPTAVGLTVTASPSRGQDVTIDLAVQLAENGYAVAPHLSARLLRGRSHLDDVVARCRAAGIDGLFVVGGDPCAEPSGFRHALAVLEALQESSAPFRHVGIGGHPDGIPGISREESMAALAAKAPLATHITTQMDFRPDRVVRWAKDLTEMGITLPVHVGVPGVVSRQKLLRISARLGIAESAKYLAHQQGVARRFFSPSGYRPDALVATLAPHFSQSDNALCSFHVFTFNELESTESWRRNRTRR